MALTKDQKRLVRLMILENPTEERMELFASMPDEDVIVGINEWKVQRLQRVNQDLSMLNMAIEPQLAERQKLNKIKTFLETV